MPIQITKTFNPGAAATADNFTTTTDVWNYIKAADLVALDHDVDIIAHAPLGTLPNDICTVSFNATHRIRIRPHDSKNINLLKPNVLDMVVGDEMLRLTRRQYNHYMGWGVDYIDLATVITSNTTESILFVQAPSIGKLDGRFIRCRFLDLSTHAGYTFDIQNSIPNGGELFEKCVFISEASAGNNGWFRNRGDQKHNMYTVAARGPAIGNMKLIDADYAGNTTCSNIILINSTLLGQIANSNTTLVNCFSNVTPTAGQTNGVTVVSGAGALVMNEANDYRLALTAPAIGAAPVAENYRLDILGNTTGDNPDVGAHQRVAAVVEEPPVVGTPVATIRGQRVRVKSTFTGNANSGTISITAVGGGAVSASGPAVINNTLGEATYEFSVASPGDYTAQTSLTNTGGTGASAVSTQFTVDVPAVPTIAFTSRTSSGSTVTFSGTYTGFPTSGVLNLPADATTPAGAVSKTNQTITFSDNFTWTCAVTGVSYGKYGQATATATNVSGTGNATAASGFTLYAPGATPPGTPSVELPAFVPPAFTAATVAVNSKVTDVTFESEHNAVQTNVPFTFGQPFKPGQIPIDAKLVGKIAGQPDIPLQVNMKASHTNGSARHAIISGVLPSLAAGALVTMDLVRSSTGASTVGNASSTVTNAGFTAQAKATIGGVLFTASPDAALAAGVTGSKVFLHGSECTEWIVMEPLKNASNEIHATLAAQFAVRYYPGPNKVEVDITIEYTNPHATVVGPTADFEFMVGGVSAYTKAGLGHAALTRWMRTLWWNGTAPKLHIKHNVPYLFDSMALSNIDQTTVIPESLLAEFATLVGASGEFEPLSAGVYTPDMGAGGGRSDIGLLPSWHAVYALCMDKRAKKMTLATGKVGGSWSIHMRDHSNGPGKGLPISIVNWPKLTILGNTGDANNSATGQNEKVTAPGGLPGFAADTAHQPNFAYLPYLLTGRHYFLEELQFWASFSIGKENPGYRGDQQGIMFSDQVRGQAWGMRVLGEAFAVTPDDHYLKPHYKYVLDTNFAAANARWTDNPDANALRVNDSFTPYYGGNGIANWQQDHYVSMLGHLNELGISEAGRLLVWMGKFQRDRFLAPGVCWLFASNYATKIRDASGSPIYPDYPTAYQATANANGNANDYLNIQIAALPCNSTEQLAKRNEMRPSDEPAYGGPNTMVGYYNGNQGYPANLQPALSYAVDAGVEDADLAWDLFMTRASKPDYGTAPQSAIVPRGFTTVEPPPASTVTSVTISPSTATGSTTFTATVNGTNSPSQAVNFSATAGTINSSGVFTAPAQTGSVQTITITATSAQDATKSGTATVTIAAAAPNTRTLTLELGLTSGAASNLTDLSVAIHAELSPHLFTTPIFTATGETTDASGNLVCTWTSGLAAGTTVHVTVLGANLAHYNGRAVLA